MNADARLHDLILLNADEGRRYEMGGMTAIFKADEAETDSGYAVSEWVLDAGFDGGGPHRHAANDEIFFVVEGEPDILIGETWHTVKRGAFVRIPGNIDHDFRNRTQCEARLLNVFIPGGFEKNMPAIVSWFEENQTNQQGEKSGDRPC
ncbi:MAG: cupin domain-containing protein [Rhodospirillales bacterium]|nr:cupin domain-containing protein [Rhodospirillales bacterium]